MRLISNDVSGKFGTGPPDKEKEGGGQTITFMCKHVFFCAVCAYSVGRRRDVCFLALYVWDCIQSYS